MPTFSVFQFTSKGGSQRRDLFEHLRKKKLDAEEPALRQKAEAVATGAGKLAESLSGFGRQMRAGQREIARGFAPPLTATERQGAIFRKKAGTPQEAERAFGEEPPPIRGRPARAFL